MDVLPVRKHVAVLPPEVVGKEPEVFGAGLTHFLARELMKLTGDSTLQVASPGLVRSSGVRDPEEARSEMGANLALRTRLQTRSDGWHARLTLIDTRHDQILAERTVEARNRDALGLARDVVAASVDMLHLDESGDLAPPRFATEASGAFAAWLEGMGHFHAAQDSAALAQSMDDFKRARSIDPECPLSATGLSHVALRMYRFTKQLPWLEEAEAQGRRAVELDGSRPEAHLALARVLSWAGDCEGAAVEFRRVVELDPVSEDGYYQLGRLWTRCGDYERAEAVYRAAVGARPHAWPAYWWLGRFYIRQGRLEEAEAEYRHLTLVNPDNFRGHANLGGLLVLSGRFAEAAEVLERALALKHSNTALSNLATAYFNQRDFDQAILGYQEAVDAGLLNHEIWGNLGDAFYWAPGKREHARPPYEEALRMARERLRESALDPQDQALALAYIANIFPKLDMPDSAAVYLGRSLALSPDDYDVHYYAALVNWQLGRTQEALGWLERAVEGGYSRVWLRDSPVFDTWRKEERFRELMAAGEFPTSENSTPNQGG